MRIYITDISSRNRLTFGIKFVILYRIRYRKESKITMIKNRVLALDASTTHVGFVVASDKYEVGWQIAYKGDLDQRMLAIGKEVQQVLFDFLPHWVAIENPVFIKRGRGGTGGVPTFYKLSKIIGMVQYLCLINGVKVLEVHPWSVKLALAGARRASKKRMREAACSFLGLSEIGEHHADAVGVWLSWKKKVLGR